MDRALAVAVSSVPTAAPSGIWQRHTSPSWPALSGYDGGGRWGRPGSFPVLYLGRPDTSVVVEAYRHLVDDIEGMRPELTQPRVLVACRVACTNILDLRSAETITAAGLSADDLRSPVDDYTPCQEVAAVAHQLGLHGIIAPAATGLGETLALFERNLPADELPVQEGAAELWDRLPVDPRRLRAVDDPPGA